MQIVRPARELPRKRLLLLTILRAFLGEQRVDKMAFLIAKPSREIFSVPSSHSLGPNKTWPAGGRLAFAAFFLEQLRDASPLRAFRFRFPWLLAIVASGTICAFVASFYEVTLTKTVMLAFFLTLVLALGESVSSQSMDGHDSGITLDNANV